MSEANGINAVSTRELYTQIGSLRTEMNARLDKIEEALDSKFEMHRVEHEREDDRRASRIRWAVTSLLTGAGVIAAIVVPFFVR